MKLKFFETTSGLIKLTKFPFTERYLILQLLCCYILKESGQPGQRVELRKIRKNLSKVFLF